MRHFEKPNKIEIMKIYLQLFLLSAILLTFSCKENTTKQKTSKNEKQIEFKNKIKDLPKDSGIKEKNKETPKHYEHKFVVT